MTSLELTDKEKDLFMGWLTQRELAVTEELSLLKNLRQKIEKTPEVESLQVIEPSKQSAPEPAESDNKKAVTSASWVEIIKKELQHFTHPVASGEIVKRLLQKNAFSQKGKRFITKAVTSKLWLLQERGEVIKEKENGKFVYSLKKR